MWHNKFVEDMAKNNLDHVVTLKIHESFTIQRDTLSKCQIYNELNSPWTINVFLLFCSFVFLQIGRERGYTKFGIRKNSPKVTYLIFRRGSTGESFLFHGLIDFKLFLTLAWRTWVPRVRDMFLSSSPEVMAMGLSATSPFQ